MLVGATPITCPPAPRTRRCREQNDRNGRLVGARLQRVDDNRAYGPGSGDTRAFVMENGELRSLASGGIVNRGARVGRAQLARTERSIVIRIERLSF